MFPSWGYSDSKCTTKHNASPVIGLCVDVTCRLPGSLQRFLSEISDSDGGRGSLVASLKPGVGLSYFLLQRCHFKGGWDSSKNYTQGAKPKWRRSEGTSVSPWGRSLMWCSRNWLTCIGKIMESSLAISLCNNVTIITAGMGVKVHKSTCLHKAYNLRNWPLALTAS